jgi:hypothetical protein
MFFILFFYIYFIYIFFFYFYFFFIFFFLFFFYIYIRHAAGGAPGQVSEGGERVRGGAGQCHCAGRATTSGGMFCYYAVMLYAVMLLNPLLLYTLHTPIKPSLSLLYTHLLNPLSLLTLSLSTLYTLYIYILSLLYSIQVLQLEEENMTACVGVTAPTAPPGMQ